MWYKHCQVFFVMYYQPLRLDYQPLFGKGARSSPPNSAAGLMDLALLILTNEKSACLNRAGCINYLSRSSKEVTRYDERSR